MFNLGFSELFVVFVIALLIVKPRDIPKIAHRIGEILGTFKQYRDSFLNEIDSINIVDKADKSDLKNKTKYQSNEGQE